MEDRSFDLAAVPLASLAFGTSDSMVFAAIALHGSGSLAYLAFSSAEEALPLGLADEDASAFLELPLPESLPESDEQPHDREDHRNGCAGEDAGETRG